MASARLADYDFSVITTALPLFPQY